MWRFVVRRLLWSIPVLLLLIFATFALMRAVPGGPFDFTASEKALPENIKRLLEEKYHVDDPVFKAFLRFLVGDIVDSGRLSDLGGLLKGDLGLSMRQRGRSVSLIIGDTFPISFQLGVMALLLALTIGIPAGIFAALNQNTWIDYLSTFIAILGVSIPALVLGPLLIYIFALNLKWLPVSLWGATGPFFLGVIPPLTLKFFEHAALPAVSLGTVLSASIARLTRASLLQVIREDYIRTARAKGLAEHLVIVRHALKNSMIPVATVIGPMFAAVVTGTFVVERIFAVPGMGRYFVESINNRDYSLIASVTLVYAVLLVAANLLVDVTYGWLDPRIRYE